MIFSIALKGIFDVPGLKRDIPLDVKRE